MEEVNFYPLRQSSWAYYDTRVHLSLLSLSGRWTMHGMSDRSSARIGYSDRYPYRYSDLAQTKVESALYTWPELALSLKPNYQALFGTSLDPETKIRGGASSLALPAYNI